MEALNFFKFWRNTSPTSTIPPRLVAETDTDSDEDDSFFDLELTVNDFDNNERPQVKNTTRIEELNVPPKTTLAATISPNEPISKRKVLPIEPISKPQSPIALLRSAPSFRVFTFKKNKQTEPCEKKVFAVKINIEDFHSSPTLSRDNSSRSFASTTKLRNQSSEEQQKPDRFSKDALHKYFKIIKPLYDRVSKRNSEKGKFSGEGRTAMATPSVVSVSSRKEKQGGFPAFTKNLGKCRSAGTVAGVGSPANRTDDTLLQQHDGIQSAILHCKRSFNSRDSSVALSAEGSICSLRNSF